MSCKRSSAAPIPFGFQLSVARSRRFALPVTARSAPCGFVPLRQSRRNTVLRTPSYRAECLFFCFTAQSPFSAQKGLHVRPFKLEQLDLFIDAARVAGQAAARADHAVAGDDERNIVVPHRTADGLRRHVR